jgi:hypothetical protein
MPSADFYGHYIDYIHRIIGRYHPFRLLLLYPIYVLASYVMAVGTVWAHSRRNGGILPRVGVALELLCGLPVNLAMAWYRLVAGTPGATGKVRAARAHLVSEAISSEADPIASP